MLLLQTNTATPLSLFFPSSALIALFLLEREVHWYRSLKFEPEGGAWIGAALQEKSGVNAVPGCFELPGGVGRWETGVPTQSHPSPVQVKMQFAFQVG